MNASCPLRRPASVLSAFLVFLGACGEGATPPIPDPVVLSLTPDSVALVVDETATLQVSISDGSTGVRWSSSNSGVATVTSAGVVQGVAPGTARIDAVAASDASATDGVTVTVTDACAVTVGTSQLGPIGSAGATSQGSLGTGDCIREGVRADRWALELPTDVGLTLGLEASFTPRLILERADGSTILDSGVGTGQVGFGLFLPPGSYVLVVTGGTGSYTLRATEIDRCAIGTGRIAVGETQPQAVTGVDCPLPSGRRADFWDLTLDQRQSVTVRATSGEFNPTVVVTGTDTNDPEAGTPAARFDGNTSPLLDGVTAFLDAGNYRVWVVSEEPGPGGAYQLSVAPGEGAMATMGVTGLEYTFSPEFSSSAGREAMVRNALRFLSGGKTGVRMLATNSCDPRTDPKYCRITDKPTLLDAFFSLVAEFGTVEYADPSTVADFTAYDIVLADYCTGWSFDAGARTSVHQGLTAAVDRGGRVLVLAQAFCDGTPANATTLTEPLGVRFTDLDPFEVEEVTIPAEQRTGFLTGVATLNVRRLTPQVILDGPWKVGAQASTGVLATYRVFPQGGG